MYLVCLPIGKCKGEYLLQNKKKKEEIFGMSDIMKLTDIESMRNVLSNGTG